MVNMKLPNSATGITPMRSDMYPIAMPPRPKPIIVTVYGIDPIARLTPKSALTGFSPTIAKYITPPLMLISARAASARATGYAGWAASLFKYWCTEQFDHAFCMLRCGFLGLTTNHPQ